jgi:phosphate-selective porin
MRSLFSVHRLSQAAVLGAFVFSSPRVFAQATAPEKAPAATTPEAPKAAPAPAAPAAPVVPPAPAGAKPATAPKAEAPKAEGPQPTGSAAGSAFSAPPSPDAPEVPAQQPEAQPPAAPVVDANGNPPPDIQSVADDLQGLRSDLENFKFQWQHEIDIHTATTTRALQLGGTIQTRFGYTNQATQNAVVYNRKTTFDVPTALIFFNGNLYKDYEEGRNLTYSLRYGVSQQTNTNNSFLNLLDASITYSLLPTISPEEAALTITAGQQLLPFGLEVPASEELKPVINNAQFTTRLNLARRDVGLIVKGDLFTQVDYGYNYRQAALAYAFGIVNGAGPNTPDDNDNKDLLARLAFTLPSDYNSYLRELKVGVTGYWGKQNLYTTDAAKTLQGKGVKNRYGIDVYYNHWPFGFTYEFIRGRDATLTPTSTPQKVTRANLDSQSHTATFFLSFGEQFEAGFKNQGKYNDWWPKTFQPFVRVDIFDSDIHKPDTRTDTYTAGLNVFFAETTKFQLNYNRVITWQFKDNPPQPDPRVQANQRFQNQVLAQFQFGF